MQLLSDDDLNLRDLSDEELARAWDLWFDLAQTTNDDDPPYTHGVLVDLPRLLDAGECTSEVLDAEDRTRKTPPRS